MKSKTSYFNATLFKNTAKRFWPIFAAYLAIWLMVLPASMSSTLGWMSKSTDGSFDLPIQAAHEVCGSIDNVLPVMAAIFAVLFAMAAFSYLYNPKSVSMVCSLPVKRGGAFLSYYSYGIVAMVFANVVVFLLTIVVEASYGALIMSYLWQWLAISCLECLFFYGFAALCASFTGNVFVLPFVYAILNFVVVLVEYFVRLILSGVYYGISNSSLNLTLSKFSPLYELLSSRYAVDISNAAGEMTGYEISNWPLLIIYGCVGIAFTVFALLLVKNRKMETAGDVVAIKPLKPVFKYCMTLGCALVLGDIINYCIYYSNDLNAYDSKGLVVLIVCMLIGAFIGYFASEMLMQKTLKVFKGKVWVGFGISCAVIVVLMLSCIFDIYGFETRVPDASEIESVDVRSDYDTVTLKNADNINNVIELHKSIITNKDKYSRLGIDTTDPDSAYYNDSQSYDSNYKASTSVLLSYNLKNGRNLTREYTLYYDVGTKDCDALNDIINSQEAVDQRKMLSMPVSVATFNYGVVSYTDPHTGEMLEYRLSAEEAVDLYNNCIVPDIENGGLGHVWLNQDISVVNGQRYYDTVMACSIGIDLSSGGDSYESFNTTVTSNAAKTLEWLKSYGIVPVLETPENTQNSLIATEKSVG